MFLVFCLFIFILFSAASRKVKEKGGLGLQKAASPGQLAVWEA